METNSDQFARDIVLQLYRSQERNLHGDPRGKNMCGSCLKGSGKLETFVLHLFLLPYVAIDPG